MAPASTGSERTNNTAVTSTAQTNKGTRSNVIPKIRKLAIVEMKLTAPKIELTPAR